MDENYEDYRIDVGYRMAIAPWRARSYIEGGKENFCGFAIDAAQVSGVTEAGDFIDLFCGAIAPAQFSPSEPIHILEVPANPFVQASRAVGALHPDALPVAILKYLAQIKVLHALQGQGAPLAYALSVFRGDLENTEMIPFPDECPPMLEHIAPEDWQEELEYFPRDEEPEWARRLMDR